MKCFYHTDLDGKFAAQCVYLYANIPTEEIGKNSEFIPINYNKEFPIKSIEQDEHVYIVDFSINPDDMRKLLEITRNVVWIDHHGTAIDKYKGFEHEIDGLRSVKESGCMLAWIYFNCDKDTIHKFNTFKSFTPRHKAPDPIQVVGDYDIHRFEFGEETKNFVAGLSLCDCNPGSMDMDMIFSNPDSGMVRWIARNGWLVNQYRYKSNHEFMVNNAYRAKFYPDGIASKKEYINCIAMNKGACSSASFGEYIDSEPLCISYMYDGRKWTVSLYSTQIHVEQLALEHFNGGGHKGAAGFVINNLSDCLEYDKEL